MARGNESMLHFNKLMLNNNDLEAWQYFMMLLIIVTSAMLNGSVLIRNFRFRANLQRNCMLKYFLMCSLAISDLCQSTLGISLQLISFYHGFVPRLCQTSGFVIAFFAYASIITTILLNIESYIHICQPWVKEKITSSRLSIQAFCFCFAWLYALFWAAFPLVRWNDYSKVIMGACTINWDTENKPQRNFIILLFVFCIVVPFALMALSSIQNNKAIREMKRFAMQHFGAKSPAVHANLKAESTILKLTVIGASAFLIAWIPYSSFSLVRFFGLGMNSHKYSYMEKVSSLCAKLACISNPLIYAYSQKSFRKDMRRLLKVLLCAVSVKRRPRSVEDSGIKIKSRERASLN